MPSTALSPDQYGFLTRPIAGNRVQQLRGQSHLEAWDVRRHLIRVFGFDGFDIETKALDLVREIEYPAGAIKYANGGANQRTVWTVVYRAEIRLSIKVDGRVVAVFEDGASGDSQNQPSLGDAHDQAMKTALSQGLKRCAVNLGDQFGMSLYNGGSAQPVVQRSLVAPGEPAGEVSHADDEPVRPEPQAEAANGAAAVPAASAALIAKAARAIAAAVTADELERIGRHISGLVDSGELAERDATELRRLLVARLDVVTGPADEKLLTRLHTALTTDARITDRQGRLDFCSAVIARTITTTKELTVAEVDLVLEVAKQAAGEEKAEVPA